MSLAPAANALAKGGTVEGTVAVKSVSPVGSRDKSDRSGVVVWLSGAGLRGTPEVKPAAVQTMKQTDKQFVPRVLAVPVGGRVDFPNEDRIEHNVFSLSGVAEFDLDKYKRGESKSVTFPKPGIVTVFCDMHETMWAAIRVLDTPWFAVTDKDGRFTIKGVPAGTFDVTAWTLGGPEWHGKVTVADGQPAKVAIEVVEDSRVPRHTRKDGQPYGRYQ